MTLENPNILERLRPHWKIIATIVGLIVVLGVVLFTIDRCSTNRDIKRTEEKKEAIKDATNQIANVSNQITQLEIEREGLRANVNRDMQQLQKDVFGREEAKREANQALANFMNAVNANTNVDRTAEDLERILRELDK